MSGGVKEEIESSERERESGVKINVKMRLKGMRGRRRRGLGLDEVDEGKAQEGEPRAGREALEIEVEARGVRLSGRRERRRRWRG